MKFVRRYILKRGAARSIGDRRAAMSIASNCQLIVSRAEPPDAHDDAKRVVGARGAAFRCHELARPVELASSAAARAWRAATRGVAPGRCAGDGRAAHHTLHEDDDESDKSGYLPTYPMD
eukprot:5065118-Pleurochrysis_carterae.AAC.2